LAPQIPAWQGSDASVRVNAGAIQGEAGAMQRPRTLPVYLDLHLDVGARFEPALQAGRNAVADVCRSALAVVAAPGQAAVSTQRMAILANTPDADGVTPQGGALPTRALLIAGAPLREPIAQHESFVMNAREPLDQAVQDFQAGRLA
jgi:hypothetical protein